MAKLAGGHVHNSDFDIRQTTVSHIPQVFVRNSLLVWCVWTVVCCCIWYFFANKCCSFCND